MHHKGLMTKSLILQSFTSLEYLDLVISSGSVSVRLINVYRPPTKKGHNISVRTFLDEFANLLEDVIIYPGRIFIVGDFNLHVDKYDDLDAIAFLDLLEQFDLKQCVNTSTHKHGHTLDLVITRRSDVFVTSMDVSFQLLFDHAVVTCNLVIPQPRSVEVLVNHRQLSDINTKNLANDIQISSLILDPKSSLDDLVDQYNTSLKSIVDVHALMKNRWLTLRPHAP